MRWVCVTTQRQFITMLMTVTIIWLQGCASTPKTADRSTLEQPTVEPEQIPWNWSLKLEDQQWDLDYVKRGNGNIKFQSIYKPNEYPEELIDALEMVHSTHYANVTHSDFKDKLLLVGNSRESLLWLPRTGADFPYDKLPKETISRGWGWALRMSIMFPPYIIMHPFFGYVEYSTLENYAAAIRQAKINEAGSVKAFNQQFQKAVERYHSIKANVSSYNNRQHDKNDAQYSDQVFQVWNQYKESISERVHEQLEFVINDQTGYGLVDQLDGLDPQNLVVVDVQFDKRQMRPTDYPDNDRFNMTTPSAETLDKLEEQLDQVASELERHKRKASDRDEAFDKRIEKFDQSLSAGAFSVQIKPNDDVKNRFFDAVSLSTPQVTTSEQRVKVSGPVELTVQKVDLDTDLGQSVSVIPAEAVVRAEPSDNAAIEKRISGQRVGYTLALDDRPHAGWRRLFDRESNFVGWVRTNNVGSIDEARQAEAMRVLKESRPNGKPTAEAIQLLLEAQQSKANEAMPDFGDLMGDMSYQSLRVITCDQAVGEAGYWCDVKGKIDTNNAGVARLQQFANALSGRGSRGGSGVVPFNAQVRVVKNRQGRWELMATKSNNP